MQLSAANIIWRRMAGRSVMNLHDLQRSCPNPICLQFRHLARGNEEDRKHLSEQSVCHPVGPSTSLTQVKSFTFGQATDPLLL